MCNLPVMSRYNLRINLLFHNRLNKKHIPFIIGWSHGSKAASTGLHNGTTTNLCNQKALAIGTTRHGDVNLVPC